MCPPHWLDLSDARLLGLCYEVLSFSLAAKADHGAWIGTGLAPFMAVRLYSHYGYTPMLLDRPCCRRQGL